MDTEIPLQFQQQQSHQTVPQHPQLQNELTVVRRAGRQAVRAFLESHNCFAVLKISAKVVVFDTRIPIQLAFYALVEHGELVDRLYLWKG
jgi:5'-AMP-activated protein kinase, regulatory gamma subunit